MEPKSRLPLTLPSKAAGANSSSLSSPMGIASSSRSHKEVSHVIFTCICGEDVPGIITFVDGIPVTIRCCNCGYLHQPEKIVIANFGTDCKHPVRVYDPKMHEYTCVECFHVEKGKLRADRASLPDTEVSGGVAGSCPPGGL